MLGVEQGVTARNVKTVEVDVVQEHVDAAEVVCGGVLLLTIEALAHVLGTKELGELKQQRARTAGRVVHLVHTRLVAYNNLGEELRNLLRRKELTARLAGVGRVHVHEVLVGVTEQVDLGVAHTAEVEIADSLDNLGEAGVALGQIGT